MECMDSRPLKSSFSEEQMVFEDSCCLDEEKNVVSNDDFPVEDFFDFCNEESELKENEEDEEKEKHSLWVSSSHERLIEDNNSNSTVFSAADDSPSLLDAAIADPGESLSELEWVSRYVDDYPLEVSLLYPVYQTKIDTPTQKRPEPVRRQTGERNWSFPSTVPARPRTKLPRISRIRSSRSAITESNSSSSLSSSTMFSSTPCLIVNNTCSDLDWFRSLSERTAKRQKKSPVQAGGSTGATNFQRRCSHCQVQKTPQWRTGPLGTKTLCNACGVRYKSGRLFPEYRPSCCPTFSGDIHSNSHRKVLELRKRKEMDERRLN